MMAPVWENVSVDDGNSVGDESVDDSINVGECVSG